MIKVYHLDAAKVADDLRCAVMIASAADQATVADNLMRGGVVYAVVAEVDTDDLEIAWRLTNNVESSWSMEPDNRVTVKAPLHQANGKTYGLRSSMVGDIFERDDIQFVVASAGFTPLPVRQTWKEVTEERYEEMLCVLPPVWACPQGIDGFMVGEPVSHNAAGYPTYTPFLKGRGKFFEGMQAMTVHEFVALRWQDIPELNAP